MAQRVSRFGLYQARVSSVSGGVGPPRSSFHCVLKRSTAAVTYAAATLPVLELRPSAITCTTPPRPERMLRSKSAGIWMTIRARFLPIVCADLFRAAQVRHAIEHARAVELRHELGRRIAAIGVEQRIGHFVQIERGRIAEQQRLHDHGHHQHQAAARIFQDGDQLLADQDRDAVERRVHASCFRVLIRMSTNSTIAAITSTAASLISRPGTLPARNSVCSAST